MGFQHFSCKLNCHIYLHLAINTIIGPARAVDFITTLGEWTFPCLNAELRRSVILQWSRFQQHSQNRKSRHSCPHAHSWGHGCSPEPFEILYIHRRNDLKEVLAGCRDLNYSGLGARFESSGPCPRVFPQSVRGHYIKLNKEPSKIDMLGLHSEYVLCPSYRVIMDIRVYKHQPSARSFEPPINDSTDKIWAVWRAPVSGNHSLIALWQVG